MVYRRRRYSRKRIYKRKVPYSVKRYVKRATSKKIEMKVRQYDYTAVGYNVTGGATVSFNSISYGASAVAAGLCSGISNGTGEGQRIGGAITLRGIQVNMVFQPGDNTNFLRLLMVTPKKQADLSSTSAFVQQVMSNAGSSATQWLNPVDTDNFKVLLDKRIWFQYRPVDGSSATSVAQARFVKKFIKFNKKIRWQISNPTVPLSEVYMIGIGDSNLAPNPGAVSGYVKLWYQDA